MSNIFELGSVMSLPPKSPLTKKSLDQIKYERGHYHRQFWFANPKGRYVLRFQIKKLEQLLLAFELQNNNVA